jgi:hypothetical protein
MADTTTETRTEARPYEPSWINRFTHWVDQLSVPGWVVYVGLGLALALVQILILWWEGGLKHTALLPVIVFNALVMPYILALVHLLDSQAVTALDVMRPTLTITDQEFDDLQCRLSTMPFRTTLGAAVILMAFLLLSEWLGSVPVRYAALDDLPVFRGVYHILDKGVAFAFGPFFYHTIVQLRSVNAIYTRHTRINLFDMKPLYAFSRLTATTAGGLIIPVHGWMLINPDLLSDPLGLGMTVLITVLAVLVFVWPLVGAHGLMETEKERMLHDLDLQFEAVFAKFNQRFRDDDFEGTELLNGTITSLEIQHNKIKSIPTWPWRPETFRSVISAIVLPLVLRVLQFLVERAFDS